MANLQYIVWHSLPDNLVTEIWLEPQRGFIKLPDTDTLLNEDDFFIWLKNHIHKTDHHIISTISTFDSFQGYSFSLSIFHNILKTN